MSARDLLIEVGTEELPPKALSSLSLAFKKEFESLLHSANLTYEKTEAFASPRRLALKVYALAQSQDDISIERFGPALQAAFDAQGNPTKAALGFAASCGADVGDLQHKSDGKLEKLFYASTQAGAASIKLIPELLQQSLAALPIPKRMRWGSSREEFVRPVHWLVLLFGDEVIPARLFELDASNQTHGHRFHHPQAISLQSADDYPSLLREKGQVEASFSLRKENIKAMVLKQAAAKNAQVELDDNLLDEVAALVEWPVILLGNFDPAYLKVPKEAVISSLKKHQKCFHLLDSQGQLLPHFITVSNIESADPSQVIKGNEKVIGPRLADAAFFFQQDLQQGLASHLDTLKRVIFQKDLGSVYDKVSRVEKLAVFLAAELDADPSHCQRAAQLCKCDLLSNMVGEFAELQGIMGNYYAQHDNEDPEVAQAIQEHYLPRFSGDSLPDSMTGIILALADRIDTITGLFGIGQPPSGSKDPFALRRAALGILRILLEKQLPLDLLSCIQQAASSFSQLPEQAGLEKAVMDFIFERLRAYFSEQGVDTRSFQAVDAVRPNLPLLFEHRVKAVSHFAKLPQAQSLAKANKRVANILTKLKKPPAFDVDQTLLTEEAELALYHSLNQVLQQTAPLIEGRQYQHALEYMATLQEPLEHFFDTVMVNVDDLSIRQNRHSLLSSVRQLFLQIADISYLQAS
jgi:glycyl-tRNA synthetase beta chain